MLKLRRKTAEVTKACEKHYALEQELAFYKIDHKFDSLSRVPVINMSDSSVVCWRLFYYKQDLNAPQQKNIQCRSQYQRQFWAHW